MTKKTSSAKQSNVILAAIIIGMITALLSGFIGYHIAYQKYDLREVPIKNTPGYITADEARNQVNNFYEQYIKPASTQEIRAKLLEGYGSMNLVFYNAYYQHGFDPITCSLIMPVSVEVTSVRPGPGAIVHAKATYPDASTANIVLTEVLNIDGFKIDTITCPGGKGNLPPKI